LSFQGKASNIARLNVTPKVTKMRHVILAISLVVLSVAATGSTINFPRMQFIEFEDPIVISKEDDSILCKKYNRLFMEVLHRSLECSEDYGPPPHKYEECEQLSRLLSEYSRLRSYYCYGEQEEEC